MDFRELAPQGLIFNSFGAKRARGMIARARRADAMANWPTGPQPRTATV